MNGIFGAGPDAMFFASAVFGSGKNGHEVLSFEASRTAGRYTKPAASAGMFDNDR